MTTTVLFLCPHGAAKSTSSTAFLRQHAERLGLDLTVMNAGTDPDDVVNPTVKERLDAEGLGYVLPRQVTPADLDAADVIINIGCEREALSTSTPIHEWTIPNFSDGPTAAFAAIEAHVTGLATGLASRV